METKFYKLRRKKLIGGVVAGLADKYHWDLTLARILTASLIFFNQFVAVIYILLALFLPYKEDLERDYRTQGQGPRKRKNAEVVHEETDKEDGWFW